MSNEIITLEVPVAVLKSVERFATAIEREKSRTIASLFEIGKQLKLAHAVLSGHGSGCFGKWVQQRCGFTPQTAGNYMRVVSTFPEDDLKTVFKSADPTALYYLSKETTPEDAIFDAVALAESGVRLTLDAAKEIVRKHNPSTKPVVHSEPIEDVTDDLQSLIDAGHKFGTIYADPPWRYGNVATRANVDRHYAGTMSVEEVCAMPVEQLLADDAHCHLWTTNGFLREAFDVLTAWGFEYRSCFVWVKPQMGIGNYWRVSHEFMLLGIRGDAKRFAQHNHMSWLEADRTKHSAKPDEIRGIIEHVSPGPFLELFGRGEVPGWTVFGNQVHAQRRFA